MTRVRYFAAAAESAGLEEESITAASVGDLRSGILEAHPGIAPVLARCALLADGSRVDDDAHSLAGVDTVDVLPPFAGG